jgi:hypothetical protein
MFDAMKFDGDKIEANEFDGNLVSVSEILGTYQVRMERNDAGDVVFSVTDREPTGRLLIYRADGKDCAMYFENSVETSGLVDLL